MITVWHEQVIPLLSLSVNTDDFLIVELSDVARSRWLFLRSIGFKLQGDKNVIVKVQIVQNIVILFDFF